jgi:NADPH:quinone reductase
MYAIRVSRFGGPEVLEDVELPDPVPGKGEVLVRLGAAGVNPVDTYIRAGAYGAIPLPFTPGSDGGGTVEAVGKRVSAFKTGDPVYVFRSKTGTYAELCISDESYVRLRPKTIDAKQGAALGVPYGTAYHALFHLAKAKKGETVLVHGASGGVGIAATQLAHEAGLSVIGTAGTKEGMDLVLAQGASSVFDHHDPDYLEMITSSAGENGITIILEMLADVNLAHDLALLAQRGRVIIIGSHGSTEINPRTIMTKELDVMGMLLMKLSIKELTSVHRALGPMLKNGKISPIIGKEIPLRKAARAHEEIMKGGAKGKIVLIPDAS